MQASKETSEKIIEGVKEKCLKNSNFFIASDPIDREAWECRVNILREASAMNGLTREWKDFEQRFKRHINAWKQCDSIDDKSKRMSYVFYTEKTIGNSC